MKSNVLAQQFSVALLYCVISVLCLAAGPTDSRNLLPGGDFQKCAENSKGPSGWDSNGRVVKEPGSPQNLVMQITGPDEMGFECPLNLPAGVHSVRVSFRILVPAGLKFDPEVPDAKGVRLRVTLYDKGGSSGVQGAHHSSRRGLARGPFRLGQHRCRSSSARYRSSLARRFDLLRRCAGIRPINRSDEIVAPTACELVKAGCLKIIRP